MADLCTTCNDGSGVPCPTHGNETHIIVSIAMDKRTGQVSVSGPLQSEVLVYGLLEKARQVTEDFARRASQPLITPAATLPFRPREQ